MTLQYNAPPGDKSTIDGENSNQMNSFYWLRASLTEARKDQYFTPLADVTRMPQHFGKTMKVYQYVPILDDRNVNDQGIDANGVTYGTSKFTITGFKNLGEIYANADILAYKAAIDAIDGGHTTVTGATNVTGIDIDVVQLTDATEAQVITLLDAYEDLDGSLSREEFTVTRDVLGNLYGSSKDIGTILSKLPTLGESGGRFNRVSITRLERSGSLQKFGFFYEFTNESIIFDSDAQLKQHLARELMNGAVQVYEATLQADLLTNATQTVVYAGGVSDDVDLTGDTTSTPTIKEATVVEYEDFGRLDKLLTAARTPTQTTIITGSRNVDTRVIPAARIAYVGPDLIPLLKRMKDPFGNQAFIGVQHYAAAGTTLPGERGSIDNFRIIEVPEMQYWEGGGAVESDGENPGYQVGVGEDGQVRYNVYPILVVGDGSFTTIGLQSNGRTGKFTVITKMPGRETANLADDPYGEKGFSSMKWFYGSLVFRPERLGIIKTIATV